MLYTMCPLSKDPFSRSESGAYQAPGMSHTLQIIRFGLTLHVWIKVHC